MKLKKIHKIVLDWLLLVLLMVQMGRHLWGNTAHEWTGAGMFALFIVHQLFNLNWYKVVFKGRYTPFRVLQLVINLMVFAAMTGLVVSGIMLSQQVFAFLPVRGAASFARILHMLSSYWGFVLMALHLGLHWQTVTRWHWEMATGRAKVQKALKTSLPSFTGSIILGIAGTAIAGYGIYAFMARELLSYMFMQNQFVFFDYQEPKILFYLDQLAMMGAFIWMTHNAAKLLGKGSTGKKKWLPEALNRFTP